jgi:hypothetical protein
VEQEEQASEAVSGLMPSSCRSRRVAGIMPVTVVVEELNLAVLVAAVQT